MPRRPRKPVQSVPDEVLVGLANGFISEHWTTNEAAKWLRAQTPPIDVGRTRVYGLLDTARQRGLFRLQVGPAERVEKRLAILMGVPIANVRVVPALGSKAVDQLALHGAEVTLDVMREIAQATHYDQVRLGLGGGRALRGVATQLSSMLAHTGDVPPFAVHALSSGFDPLEPQNVPVTFLGAFEPYAQELVGLFSSGVFEADARTNIEDLPGVAESFKRAQRIDVVVTSIASAHDQQGALYRFLAHSNDPGLKRSRDLLVESSWKGDILYQPFAEDGPIDIPLPVRPVSVLGISDLRKLVRRPNKAVILVVGPSQSGRSKADALLPLIRRPELRVWTHLVVDVGTAEQVIRELEQELP